MRTDGLAGSGTQADPYDGSTAPKFDAVLRSFYWTPNLGVHLLGAGPFQTSVTHNWAVQAGWIISGDGMDVTTLKMVGNVAGIHYAITCFSSDSNLTTDNVTIRDLTVDCNWAQLSLTADTGAGGEKNIKTGAVSIWGNNNLIDHLRCINSYGSWANGQEHFAIMLAGPRSADGTNNVIQFCRAESPQGNYGNPFALAGWVNTQPNYLITNSRVLSCAAVGVRNGGTTGFTSGGVNLANIKDCWVDSSSFTDCYGAAYIDTGSVDGLHVTNNTVVRGWCAVGLDSLVSPKQNVEISGNNFQIQNRVPGGGSYAVFAGYAPTTNLTVSHNTISFDVSGVGLNQFWGIDALLLNTATISDNVIGMMNPAVINQASGTAITLLNNVQTDGSPVPGL